MSCFAVTNQGVQLLPAEPWIDDNVTSRIEELLSKVKGYLDTNGEGWRAESRNKEYRVLSNRVQGSKLRICLIQEKYDVPAEYLYNLMTSVEGFKIIDPDTKNHEEPPVKVLEDVGQRRAELVHAKAPMPRLQPRSFLVTNIFDKKERMFASHSVLSKLKPVDEDNANGFIRAINVFGLRTLADPQNPGRCTLEMVNYLELRGTLSKCAVNALVCKVFFQKLRERLHKWLADHAEPARADVLQPHAA